MVPGDVSKGPWGIPAKKKFKLRGDQISAHTMITWFWIILLITSFVQYNRPCLPVLFWRVVFRNRTGIIHFRLMKMISFQCKTAKNQFYLLMMLIVNKTLLNLRSENRTRLSYFGTFDFRLVLFPIKWLHGYEGWSPLLNILYGQPSVKLPVIMSACHVN